MKFILWTRFPNLVCLAPTSRRWAAPVGDSVSHPHGKALALPFSPACKLKINIKYKMNYQAGGKHSILGAAQNRCELRGVHPLLARGGVEHPDAAQAHERGFIPSDLWFSFCRAGMYLSLDGRELKIINTREEMILYKWLSYSRYQVCMQYYFNKGSRALLNYLRLACEWTVRDVASRLLVISALLPLEIVLYIAKFCVFDDVMYARYNSEQRVYEYPFSRNCDDIIEEIRGGVSNDCCLDISGDMCDEARKLLDLFKESPQIIIRRMVRAAIEMHY